MFSCAFIVPWLQAAGGSACVGETAPSTGVAGTIASAAAAAMVTTHLRFI
jgi:hypothetical protein